MLEKWQYNRFEIQPYCTTAWNRLGPQRKSMSKLHLFFSFSLSLLLSYVALLSISALLSLFSGVFSFLLCLFPCYCHSRYRHTNVFVFAARAAACTQAIHTITTTYRRIFYDSMLPNILYQLKPIVSSERSAQEIPHS